MKKFFSMTLSVLLVLAMLLGMAACGGTDKPADDGTGDNPGESQGESGNQPAEGETGKEPEGEAPAAPTYTYNLALATFATNWNPHTYQTASDGDMLDYMINGFYTFDYNENKDGYKVIPAMATAEPEDVTAQYAGKYGLAEDAVNQAYKITIRNDIKWSDGTAIKAQDFVTSAQLLLNPKAANYRADSLYQGNLVIHNAEYYLKQGQEIMTPNSSDGETMTYALSEFVKGADGAYTTPDGVPVYFGLDTPYKWMGGSNALSAYYGAGYIPEDVWTVLKASANEDGLTPVTDETIAALYQFTGSDVWGNESQEQLGYYISFNVLYPEVKWEDVGIFANDDYSFTIVLDKPLKGFYLLYSLTDSWLVNEKLYNANISEANGVYTNTYGTAVDNTISYGPYKMTQFQSDKIVVFEKNEYWYGYSDPAFDGMYQTTRIQYDYVPEASTRLEMFLNGKLDSYALQSDDMETYSMSDYTYYTTGDSTFFIAVNPDLEALTAQQEAAGENKNKTIITIPEFRMALSFGLDRAKFCLATSPTNNAAFGAYSSLIICDPDNGTAYRSTPQAKQVIANFWGLADDIGEGKQYATIDDAIDSLTGYNLVQAQELFNTAYDKAIEQGLMDENDVVEIKIGIPNSTSNFYNRGNEFLVNNYTDAVIGTKLEGKLTFTLDNTLGNGFADALKANKVDMLFGVGWTGSALDPYNLMEAYTSSENQYDPAWDTTAQTITIGIDGKDYTASVWEWTEAILGEEVTLQNPDGNIKFKAGSTDDNQAVRLDILAALENAVLETYDMIPIMDDSSAALKSMQVKFYTEEYIYGVGRGGIRYMTYEMNDAEWDEYVTAQGGTLNYK